MPLAPLFGSPTERRAAATPLAGILLAAILCTTSAPALAATTCPATVPAGLNATPVGADIASAGLAMTVSQVEGKEDAEAILARTERQWKAAGHDVRRGASAGWQVLAAKGERCLVTLQLVQRGGSFGYLARSKPAPSMATPASMGVALPPGAQVDSNVASNDDGRQGVVVVARSSLSLEQLSQFFMEELGKRQWRATRSHQVTNTKTGVRTLFVTAQRERRQVEIVAWTDRGSQIVMTVADAL